MIQASRSPAVSSREILSLSAVLPLKVSGRHYGDNLARLDLLFSSLDHFGAPGLFDELLVIARADEAELIGRHLAHWPELPLRILSEEEHFPAFRRYNRPWQVRPWQRQQIIKLNAPALTTAPFVLTLDPDVIAVKPITRELLLPGGRAILEPEARSVHRQWWRDSASLLNVDPGLARRGINVTPALLSTTILREAQERLQVVGQRPWMDILLTSYSDWTEYTLYLLAAERAGLLELHHVWADAPGVAAHLQLEPERSIWDASPESTAKLERLFAADDRGLFGVVQSNTGIPASQVAAVAARHLPVRSAPGEPPPAAKRRSKLDERVCTASRLAAQHVYRHRQRLHRRTRGSRPRIPQMSPSSQAPEGIKEVTGPRGLLVGNHNSLAERLRRRRWALITSRIPDLAERRVVDLGGTARWWLRAPVRPRHVTVVNLFEPGEDSPGITAIQGDALRADDLLSGEEFDLVFSNGLIEHLGGHGPRRRFAEVVRSLAAAYLVQTPYRFFPVEPHWMFPGFQFLPVSARSYLAPRWPLGHTSGWEFHAAADEVMSTELLSASEMREYFPDAELVWERVAGVPKSMTAIKYPPRPSQRMLSAGAR